MTRVDYPVKKLNSRSLLINVLAGCPHIKKNNAQCSQKGKLKSNLETLFLLFYN